MLNLGGKKNGEGFFKGDNFLMIAVRAGHKFGCATQIRYRPRRPLPALRESDAALLGRTRTSLSENCLHND